MEGPSFRNECEGIATVSIEAIPTMLKKLQTLKMYLFQLRKGTD